MADSIIGTRIAVVGSSGSGKSTLAERLAAMIDVPFVELDALYWKPGWVGSEGAEFLGRIEEATSGAGWVVAGNYHRMWPAYWPRVETVVWLDVPLRVCLARLVRRSWRRSRQRELLWGTNRERFWPQLKLWSPEQSLLAWTVTRRRGMRRQVIEAAVNEAFEPLRVIRLRSGRDIGRFLQLVAPGHVEHGTQTQPLGRP